MTKCQIPTTALPTALAKLNPNDVFPKRKDVKLLMTYVIYTVSGWLEDQEQKILLQ